MDLTSVEFNRRKRFPNVERIHAMRAMLTDRERDVLSWSARGKTMSEVSEILGVSEDTIETHIRHVLSKLDAANKTHAVAKAIYLDMIDL
jgi:DNA-binding CsgD family transcriptional regulator